MATPNIQGVYDLLQRAMQQNFLQQQGAGAYRMPNSGPGYNSDGNDSPQGGLLGRLLALQAQQNPYQPLAENSRAAPAVPPDPNFRQLLRVPAANRTQGAIGPANRSENQPSPAYSPVGGGIPLDLPDATKQGAGGLFGGYGGRPGLPWVVPSPMMTLAPLGWRGPGIPMPPIASVPLPPIPMPTIPEQWKTAGAMIKLLPWIGSRLREGRGNGGNDGALGAENPTLPRLPSASDPALGAWLDAFGHQNRKGGDEEDDDRTTPEPGSDEWFRRFRKQKAAEARARDVAGRKAIADNGPDPGNYCTNRYDNEMRKCYERSHEYPDWSFRPACVRQAGERLGYCSKNGGKSSPDEPPEWGPDLEEVYNRDWRP